MDVDVPSAHAGVELMLSPSTMTRFEGCELAWILKNVWRVAGAEESSRVTVGDLFHLVAARVGRLVPAERTLDAARRITQEEIMQVSRSAAWQESGFGIDDELELGLKVWNLVESWFVMEPVAAAPIVSVESLVETRVAGVPVRGVIDRADQLADGRLVIVDYKTGRAPAGGGYERRLFGVKVYGCALEDMGYEVAELQLIYVGSGDIIRVTWDAEVSAVTRDAVKDLAGRMAGVLETGSARAVPGRHCLGCPYVAVCPAQGGTLPPPPDVSTWAAAATERPLDGPESPVNPEYRGQGHGNPNGGLRGEIPLFRVGR